MTSATPDAVYVHGSLRVGRTMRERLASVLRIAEPLLGVERARGERGYVRKLESGDPRNPDVWLYVTKSTDDQLMFPLVPRGPFSGQPRYDWIEGAPGIRLGFLKDSARVQERPVFKPPGT